MRAAGGGRSGTDGKRKQCASVSEDKLAAKLEKVRQRLSTGASNMIRPGAGMIAWYLSPDRLPVADTQGKLCQRFAARVEEARAEQEAGSNSLGLIFPPPTGKHWRSTNFNRRILQPRRPEGQVAQRRGQQPVDLAQPAAC